MARKIDIESLLSLVQQYVSTRYSASLTQKEKHTQLKSYIEKYIRDNDYEVQGQTLGETVDRLYAVIIAGPKQIFLL